MESGLRKEGVLKFFEQLDGNDEASYEWYLQEASKYARGNLMQDKKENNIGSLLSTQRKRFLMIIFLFQVVILSVRGWLVRKFMLAAYDLGMTKGDWTFLDVEIVQVG